MPSVSFVIADKSTGVGTCCQLAHCGKDIFFVSVLHVFCILFSFSFLFIPGVCLSYLFLIFSLHLFCTCFVFVLYLFCICFVFVFFAFCFICFGFGFVFALCCIVFFCVLFVLYFLLDLLSHPTLLLCCPPIPFGCSGDLALTNWSSGRKSSREAGGREGGREEGGGREGGKLGSREKKGEEEKNDASGNTSFGTTCQLFALSAGLEKSESMEKDLTTLATFYDTLAGDTRAWPFLEGA